VMVELLGYTIVLGYNVVQGYPLASFMEYVFLVVQDIFLLIVILHYVGLLDTLKLGLIGLYIAMFYGFTEGIPHANVLPFLMKFATPCSASSKILQLRKIWETKNSQTVAVTTWLIAAYTCVSRITTNLLLTGDVPLLINYSIGLLLNTLVIGSAMYFRMPNSSKPNSNTESSKDNLPDTKKEKSSSTEDKKVKAKDSKKAK